MLVAALALITSCGSGVADTASVRSPAGSSARSPETAEPAQPIERDKEPVLERFPELGDITAVEWVTKDFGRPSEMAGPTDFRVSGVAQLAKADAERLQQEHDWVPTGEAPATLAGISSRVPRGVAWKVSEGFTSQVTGGAFEATFFLDPEAGVMVFDAVSPSVAHP
ncbi:hypothetical protein AB0N06_22000 [Streptomyces sp. NPDC051020]|uniref:hypothetical protein n=1 Tax=Streptomyces sp. NPDC051020 TaxID=3155409 RepID=UPI003429ADD0